VLLDWREFRHSSEWPWGELCDHLHGAGVPNADEALWKLRLRPVHEALRKAVEQGRKLADEKSSPTDEVTGTRKLDEFLMACDKFYVRAGEAVGVKRLGVAPMVANDIAAECARAMALPAAEIKKEWAPVSAWLVLCQLKPPMFDQLLLKAGLAEIFADLDFHGEDAWRAAARVRLLLSFSGEKEDVVHSRRFWDGPDVRWLASVNEAKGKTYFNKEAFAELAAWMQIPKLLGGKLTPVAAAVELQALSAAAEAAGYEVGKFLGEVVEEEIAEEAAAETLEREAEVEAVEEEIEEAGEAAADEETVGEEEAGKPIAPGKSS